MSSRGGVQKWGGCRIWGSPKLKWKCWWHENRQEVKCSDRGPMSRPIATNAGERLAESAPLGGGQKEGRIIGGVWCWLTWSVDTNQRWKSKVMRQRVKNWNGKPLTVCFWKQYWMKEWTCIDTPFKGTVESRYTAPKNKGNPLITNAKLWSLQIISLYFLYWQ